MPPSPKSHTRLSTAGLIVGKNCVGTPEQVVVGASVKVSPTESAGAKDGNCFALKFIFPGR